MWAFLFDALIASLSDKALALLGIAFLYLIVIGLGLYFIFVR
jgi:hypothetical protein